MRRRLTAGLVLTLTTVAAASGAAAAVPAPAETFLVVDGITPPATAPTAAGSIDSDGASRVDINGAEVIIEVKFAEQLAVRGSDQNLRSRQGRSLRPVEAVLERYGGADLEPFLDAPAADRMARVGEEARERTGERVPDLASWYTVTLAADVDVNQVLAELRALPEIEHAEPAPEPAPPPSDTPDFTSLQRYFSSADDNGIDADFSRADPRVRGDSIKIVDLEYNWNPFHEDLQLDWSTDLGGDEFVRIDNFGDDHGTAVFGTLVAADNDSGVTGGVPDAEMYGISPVQQLSFGTRWRPGPALAFLAALEGDNGELFIQPGDVVLLEQQGGQVIPDSDCPVDPGTCYSPLEWNVAVHEAIQVLTSMGASVVATGGNGYNSTDHPAYMRDGEPWFRPENHSGSILVGAGHSTTRERLGFSNHGSRFDLQGWGHEIATTGYCSLYCVPDDHDVRYSDSFGGTSGAGPIVTSAVVAVQSYLKATDQEPLSAQEISDLLKATGQPQGLDTAGTHIGPLPDLRRALISIEVDPPETQAELTPEAVTGPGWHVKPIVTLASDDGWGSGTAETEYRINDGPWTTYEGPVPVDGNGRREVEYRSIDANGNVEDINVLTFTAVGRHDTP